MSLLKLSHVAFVVFSVGAIAACSISSTETNSESSSTTPEPEKCGSRTCNRDTEYCALMGKTDAKGEVTWEPESCQTYPKGCSAPTDFSPSDTCSCIAKTINACNRSGSLVLSKCSNGNGYVSFGCSG